MSISECVAFKMRKSFAENLDEDLSRKDLLGRAFGICRGDLGLKKRDFNSFSKIITDFYDIHENDFQIDFLEYDALDESELKSLLEEIKQVTSAPILTDKEANLRFPSKSVSMEKLTDRPFTAVMSSNVESRAVNKNKLYVTFHNYEGVYPYTLPSEEAALRAFHEMADASPGRYVWENLRGKKIGPVWGKPKKLTPGGTSSSLVEYTKMGRGGRKAAESRIGKVPGTDETARVLKKFKMAVKKPPTSAEPFTTTELKNFQQSQKAPKQTKLEKRDFDEEGEWITIRGTHVLIKKGATKAEQIKAWIKTKEKGKTEKEKEISREQFHEKIREETPTGKREIKEREKLKKATQKKEEVELKETRRKEREQGKAEQRIQKIIEQTGFKRERAETEYKRFLKEEEKVKPKKQDKKEIEKKPRKKEKSLFQKFLLRLVEKLGQRIAQRIASGKKEKDFDDIFPSLILDFAENAVYLIDNEGEGYIIQDSVIHDNIEACKSAFKKKYNLSDKEAEVSCFGVIQKAKGKGKEEKKEDKDKPKEKETSEVAKEVFEKTAEVLDKQREARKKQKAEKPNLKAKAKALRKKVKTMKEEIARLTTVEGVQKRREVITNINQTIKELEKITGQKVFPFIPIKKPIGRPRSRGVKKKDMIFDSVESLNFNDYGEFSQFEGYFTHSGAFPYKEDGKDLVKFKDWNNLKQVFSNTDYIHTIGSKREDSHLDLDQRVNGFATGFKFIEPNTPGIYGPEDIDSEGRIWGEGAFFDNISNLSDLKNPQELNFSIGFKEKMVGDIQLLTEVIHGAISMNNTETDRCRLMGPPCTARIKRFDFFNYDHNPIPPQDNYYDKNLTKNEKNNIIMDLIDKDDNLIKKKRGIKFIEQFNEFNSNVSFDSFDSYLSNLLKIKMGELNDMTNDKKNKKDQKEDKEQEDLTNDQNDKKNEPDTTNNTHGKELEECMQGGKTKTECTEMLARKDMEGKHEPFLGTVDESLELPPLTDTHNISKDMSDKMEKMQTEMEKMKQDFAPYLKAKEEKEQTDFEDNKKILIDTYEVCKDFIATLDFNATKTIKNAFERSDLVKEALFYKNPSEFEPPSVLDMSEETKSNDREDFSWMKMT